jgi:hypothetical protein
MAMLLTSLSIMRALILGATAIWWS